MAACMRTSDGAAGDGINAGDADGAVNVFIPASSNGSGSSGHGYVWEADHALQLRRLRRIQGSFVGGVNQYKNQNAVMGLPMELSQDEVSFLLRTGAAQLHAATLDAIRLGGQQQRSGQGAAAAMHGHQGGSARQQQQPWHHHHQQQHQQQNAAGVAGAAQQNGSQLNGQPLPPQQGGSGVGGSAGAGSSTMQHAPNKRRGRWQPAEEDYYAYYEALGAYGGGAAACDEGTADAAACRPVLRVVRLWRLQAAPATPAATPAATAAAGVAAPPPAQQQPSTASGAPPPPPPLTTHTFQRKRRLGRFGVEDDYYAYYDGVGAYDERCDAAAVDRAAYCPAVPVIKRAKAGQREEGRVAAGPAGSAQGSGQGQEGRAQRQSTQGEGQSALGQGQQQQPPPDEPQTPGLYADEAGQEAAWKAPLLEGSFFSMPLTAADTRGLAGIGAILPALTAPPTSTTTATPATTPATTTTPAPAIASNRTNPATTTATTTTTATIITVPLSEQAAAITTSLAATAPPLTSAAPPPTPDVLWLHPRLPDEWVRFIVFCDLHAKGYTLSCGAKFGADMLAYPGDPGEYHAQFTVRPVPPGQALNPILLKSAARGSHGARKHLLLATVPELEEWLKQAGPVAAGQGCSAADRLAWLKAVELPPVVYVSIAPESSFGSRS